MRRCDILFCLLHDQIDAGIIAANPQLRLVAAQSITPSNIDVEAATARGIPVTVVPRKHYRGDSRLGVSALMLAVARRVVEGDRMVRAGEVSRRASRVICSVRSCGAKRSGLSAAAV